MYFSVVLFGFPSFLFSVTAKWEKVVRAALRLSNSGFSCVFNGRHMLLAWSRDAGMTARGVMAKVVPLTLHAGRAANWPDSSGGAAHLRMLLFSSGLLCDYLTLQLIWDVGASLSVYKQVELVFCFRLRFIVLNTKPGEKLIVQKVDGFACIQQLGQCANCSAEQPE